MCTRTCTVAWTSRYVLVVTGRVLRVARGRRGAGRAAVWRRPIFYMRSWLRLAWYATMCQPSRHVRLVHILSARAFGSSQLSKVNGDRDVVPWWLWFGHLTCDEVCKTFQPSNYTAWLQHVAEKYGLSIERIQRLVPLPPPPILPAPRKPKYGTQLRCDKKVLAWPTRAR